VVAAVAAAGPITAKAVFWAQAGRPIANPCVCLSPTTDLSETNDPRTTKVPDVDTGDQALTLSTSRKATVQIRSETTNAATATDAYALSDAIELGLSLTAAAAALAAQGVVLVRVHPHNDLSYMHGDCMIYARTFDAEFRYEYHRADPTQQGTIEHVQVAGTLNVPPDVTVSLGTIDKPESV
jgi:hypothetical protein